MPNVMPIYLDHNATTPILPEVVDAMLPYLREHFGNPSSSHPYGAAARRAVALAREDVARLLAAEPDEIVFTSGGTEANNLAIFGAMEGASRRGLVTSIVEHPATSRPAARLEAYGAKVTRLGVDDAGRVHMGEARGAIDVATRLVSIMHANNETGMLQPIAELSTHARAHGALVHTDAAQSVGKVGVDVGELGVDMLTVAGHKLYAPKGVGALYVRRGVALAPFAFGAGHERGRRPGTENVASIVGLGTACAIARRELAREAARVRGLRDRLHQRLAARVFGLALNGGVEGRLPNTLSVRFPGVRGSVVLAGAPEIAASTGSACHEGGEEASAVVLAMGISPEDALGTVRLSLGRGTTEDDVDRAAHALASAWERAGGATTVIGHTGL